MNTFETLQHLDQTLIQLLGDRLSLLATLDAPTRQAQLASYQAQLAAANVPGYLWESIVTSCMAALAAAPARHTVVEPRRITVVGGRGLMGCFFVDRLSAAGHNVSVLEYDGWEYADSLLGNADLVLLCVPLKATVAVARKSRPLPLSPTATLADIASTKSFHYASHDGKPYRTCYRSSSHVWSGSWLLSRTKSGHLPRT